MPQSAARTRLRSGRIEANGVRTVIVELSLFPTAGTPPADRFRVVVAGLIAPRGRLCAGAGRPVDAGAGRPVGAGARCATLLRASMPVRLDL